MSEGKGDQAAEDVAPVGNPAAKDVPVHVATTSQAQAGPPEGAESQPLMKDIEAPPDDSASHKALDKLNAQADRNARTQLITSLAVALVWYALGVLFFTLYEKMSLVDGWYFTTVTVTSVGYGVIVPSDEVSRMVTAFYSLFSCVLIAFGLANAIFSATKTFETAIAEQGFAEVSVVRVIGFRVIMTTFMITVTITVGTVIGCVSMELSFWNAFYWSVISTTTVGYGDFTPQTAPARIWAGMFTLIGTSCFALGISQIMAIFMINQKKKDIIEFMTPPLTEEKIAAMDFDGDGEVTKDGYLKFMLVKGGFVDPHVINDLIASFHELDSDGSGVLDKADCNTVPPTAFGRTRSKINAAFEDY